MSEFTVSQVTVITYYFIAGLGFSLLFDIFTLTQKIFKNPKWLIILEDTVFWIIFILVIFTMNYNILNGEIKEYSVLGIIIGVAIYFILIRILIKKKLFNKNIKLPPP